MNDELVCFWKVGGRNLSNQRTLPQPLERQEIWKILLIYLKLLLVIY